MNTQVNVGELLKDYAEQHDVSFRNDYSGRFMYNKRCVGLDGDTRAVQNVIADVMTHLVDNLFDETIDVEDEEQALRDVHTLRDNTNKALKDLANYRTDQMGLGMIMYWPDIAPIEEDEDEEDFDDSTDGAYESIDSSREGTIT